MQSVGALLGHGLGSRHLGLRSNQRHTAPHRHQLAANASEKSQRARYETIGLGSCTAHRTIQTRSTWGAGDMAPEGRAWIADCCHIIIVWWRYLQEEGETYEAPETTRLKTWTVPLSLQTHSSRSSGRKATPKISALSVPRLNSRTSLPVTASHVLTSVPRDDVVASNRPDGGTERVVSAVVCAAIIETGCFVGGGGGFRGGDEEGGPIGVGATQGGR
jgi:hypothetical protein